MSNLQFFQIGPPAAKRHLLRVLLHETYAGGSSGILRGGRAS